MEIEVLGQHGDDARDLLLGAEAWRAGGRLEVQRHLVVDARHDLHQLQRAAVFLQHLAQRLHEPRAVGGIDKMSMVGGVPPGEVAWQEVMRQHYSF